MKEFKVGDKVIIRKRGDTRTWLFIMLEHADGKVGVIEKIKHIGRLPYSYMVTTGDLYLEYGKKSGWLYKAENLDHYNLIPEGMFTL